MAVAVRPSSHKRQHDTKLAAATVTWANEDLALTFEEIGVVVAADERTVRRWRSSEVAPRARHQASLAAFVDLRHLLGEVFGHPDDARVARDAAPRVPRAHATLAHPPGPAAGGGRRAGDHGVRRFPVIGSRVTGFPVTRVTRAS